METVRAIEAARLGKQMKIMIGGAQVDEAVRTCAGAAAGVSNGGAGVRCQARKLCRK